ncbi:hypothetical protein GALL_553210 [mine drainage metagenome]|uniref:Uncharacterized protein n=1 Tax=mine drainage metagenome TaxID=410659 RepID=A0A1J5P6S6_9ZZZZ
MALGGLNPGDLTVFLGDALHLALLDDVHAHLRTGAGIAPCDGVVARRAAARLIKRAEDRVARAVDVDDRHQFLDLGRFDPRGFNALQQVGVDGAQVAAHLVMGLRQHQEAARGEHHVVVKIL